MENEPTGATDGAWGWGGVESTDALIPELLETVTNHLDAKLTIECRLDGLTVDGSAVITKSTNKKSD